MANSRELLPTVAYPLYNLPSYFKVITASAKLVEVFSDPALESPLNLIVPHIAQIVLQPKTPNLFLPIS